MNNAYTKTNTNVSNNFFLYKQFATIFSYINNLQQLYQLNKEVFDNAYFASSEIGLTT